MSFPTQQQALNILRAEEEQLQDLIQGLSEKQLQLPGAQGAKTYAQMHLWSIKDLIAHLTLWKRMGLETLAQWRAGQVPWYLHPEFQAFDAGERINLGGFAWSQHAPLHEVQLQAITIHETLLGEIGSLSNADWSTAVSTPMGLLSLGEMLHETMGVPDGYFQHFVRHRPDLEVFLATVRERT
ncbi:ClbS/DfsB family four-helix bundle protein [Ktedonosporobacter rubrisoli]|uniref:ClbS/DfsB family four-helix bundle protein n=1 Tax=Ktedonosporobacter rubrisoli TaxID=2509675 RepID=A0A4P6JY53_KTERU|nr:DinB family protein [Ktedonosporobacter rubrisoli]QBD80719.1 ClbS/DfsB family four-helix bundle protein [Ktedonosporobacter rubrisoli]